MLKFLPSTFSLLIVLLYMLLLEWLQHFFKRAPLLYLDLLLPFPGVGVFWSGSMINLFHVLYELRIFGHELHCMSQLIDRVGLIFIWGHLLGHNHDVTSLLEGVPNFSFECNWLALGLINRHNVWSNHIYCVDILGIVLFVGPFAEVSWLPFKH